jgi:hypothetical protein
MTLRALRVAAVFALSRFALRTQAQSTAPGDPSASAALGRTRHGFFASLGFGYGSAQINCDQCTSDRGSNVSGILRIGGTLSPHVRLGLESTGWYNTSDFVDSKIELLSAVLYYYPSISNNLWIKGGGGYAHTRVSDNFNELSQDGAGITFGVGYDLPFGRSNFVLVPYAAYVKQVSGKIDFNGNHTDVSSNANIFQLGVGLGFRH